MQEQPANEYYPYALLSAFTTLPFFQPTDKFFDEEIFQVFENYKKGLDTMQAKATGTTIITDNPDYSHVYRPVPYCLFGDFDMAIFSLIDDFSFATKKFKPTPGSEGYKYQINTGIIPLVQAYKDKKYKMPKFRDKTVPRFFGGTDFYPYTGIASVKLNNAMLVGIGQPFLDLVIFFLITHLDKWVEELEGKGQKHFYILNENLGWNELTIYFFGTSMMEMQELLLKLRHFNLEYLQTHIRKLSRTIYDEIMIDKILDVFKKLRSESLLGKFIDDWEKEKGEEKDYLQSHPVMATSITYGFHIDMIRLNNDDAALENKCGFINDQLKIFKKEYEEDKCILIGWKIKPGHELAAEEMIRPLLSPQDQGMLEYSRTGKYPFGFPQKPLSIKEFIEFTGKMEALKEKEVSKNIVKLRSRIQWISKVSYEGFTENMHYEYDLKKYKFSQPLIEKIQDNLRTFPIPHIYKSQIENLMINYNDAITDPLMYHYFIGLREPLLNFINNTFRPTDIPESNEVGPELVMQALTDGSVISKSKAPPEDDIYEDAKNPDRIANFIQAWNKGYWNRYFHSYYFTEINDFNIEHHGGIQQLLFTYDVMYKLIARRIYGHDGWVPFVNVQVNHTITSTPWFNSINFIHLFRPAIYACESVHEAANHVITYLIQIRRIKGFEFLFNPRSDKIEPDKVLQFLAFEKSLHERVGAREKFEVLYLADHFGVNTVRQIVVDYATYMLGYIEPEKMERAAEARNFELKEAITFYHTHWFLFLVRADLYCRELKHTGGWYFNIAHFRTLFIRFNLMFYLFFDLNEKDLENLNKECPSIEIKKYWDSEKRDLLQFTKRLGDALKAEFTQQLKDQGIDTSDMPGFAFFREKIETLVFDENWKNLHEEQEIFKTVIKNNQELIKGFYDLFTETEDNQNIIIRNSNDIPGTPSNISFYEPLVNRDIFLDPKGNLYTTSPAKRREVFMKNVGYIKAMWSLAMKVAKRDY